MAQEDEFLQLSQERLAACLAGDVLQVQPEQSRLEALRLVRHDPQVRLPTCPSCLAWCTWTPVPWPHVQQLLASEPLIRGVGGLPGRPRAQGHEGGEWTGGGAGRGAPRPSPHGDRQDEVGIPEVSPARNSTLGSVHLPSARDATCVCHFLPVRTGDPAWRGSSLETQHLQGSTRKAMLDVGCPQRGRQSGRAAWSGGILSAGLRRKDRSLAG